MPKFYKRNKNYLKKVSFYGKRVQGTSGCGYASSPGQGQIYSKSEFTSPSTTTPDISPDVCISNTYKSDYMKLMNNLFILESNKGGNVH